MAGTSCNPRSQRKKHHQSGSGRLYGEDEEDGYLLNTLMLTTTVRCAPAHHLSLETLIIVGAIALMFGLRLPPILVSTAATVGGWIRIGLLNWAVIGTVPLKEIERVPQIYMDAMSVPQGLFMNVNFIRSLRSQRTSSTPTNDHIHTRIEDHEEFKNVVDLCSWFGVECYDSQGHASATAAAVLHLDAQDIVDRCGTAKRFRRSPVEKWRFLSQEHPAAGWSVKLCLTDSEGSSSVKLPPCELWQTFLELAVLVTWSDDFPSHCGSSHRADVEHQQSCAKYTDNLTRG
ncbi:hypothetical protein F5141DRAFT_1059923 [Pisolithus sp. B1]|nr:hypothetical protein F5141DRAFT_1059923 [Pisolithus sp. B1]